MRRRLYFLLPDVKHARQVVNELLLTRVEERHIHVLAKEGTSLEGLPEAALLERSDVRHAVALGLIVGGLTGTLAGTAVLLFPPSGMIMNLSVILVMCLIGAFMGIWVSGMIGTDTPNTHLKDFMGAIERGKVLVMVDIPKSKIQEIAHLIKKKHPEADWRGRDPTMPAFP
jgi:uncharacterized membrane protein YeaQ/YmgE (transglycosylase-associated protein family)